MRYFSIIMDSTTDITKKEQVSVILRYCTFDETGPTLVTNESFIGFFEIVDRSAKGYEALILDVLKGLNLSFAMCRGQGYDGASVMSGAHKGLQANLLKLNQHALYVHCAAHKLNLVITDGVKSRTSMSDFFDTIQSKILRSFSVLSKKLQSIEITLDECVIMWQNGIETLESLKRNICGINEEAKELARKWGVPEGFPSVRKIKKSRFHDGLGIDTARKTALTEEGLFEKEFLPVIENVICQMKTRFESTHCIYELFGFLTPSKILNLNETELSEMVVRFCQKIVRT
ncbi:Zinc finger MYM-type protein 1 [Orchesella cincta]|uniref:Zinc finger MYM-type protein 1 n=1 Tax=Orchesella cincta TaxID=48709 RepID=A0A1D2M305_ORCCI|nr:Zinc finger MYM-type protein 1 [Orchesella cincta]